MEARDSRLMPHTKIMNDNTIFMKILYTDEYQFSIILESWYKGEARYALCQLKGAYTYFSAGSSYRTLNRPSYELPERYASKLHEPLPPAELWTGFGGIYG